MKRRSGEAIAAQHRNGGTMKHRLEPRGGSQKPDFQEESGPMRITLRDEQEINLEDIECMFGVGQAIHEGEIEVKYLGSDRWQVSSGPLTALAKTPTQALNAVKRLRKGQK